MQRQTRSDEAYMRKIDYVFYHVDEIREAVLEEKKRMTRHEINNASNISDPTAAIVLKSMEPVAVILLDKKLLRRPEEWLKVFDAVKKWCIETDERFYKILRDRYSEKDAKKTCANLSISTDFYYRALEKIRIQAALYAAYLRLINFSSSFR